MSEGKVERLVLLMASRAGGDRRARGATFIWPSIAATAGHAAQEKGGKNLNNNHQEFFTFGPSLRAQEIYCFNNSGEFFFKKNYYAPASDWCRLEFLDVSAVNAGNAVKRNHLNERKNSRNLSPPNANNAETWRMPRAHFINGSIASIIHCPELNRWSCHLHILSICIRLPD